VKCSKPSISRALNPEVKSTKTLDSRLKQVAIKLEPVINEQHTLRRESKYYSLWQVTYACRGITDNFIPRMHSYIEDWMPESFSKLKSHMVKRMQENEEITLTVTVPDDAGISGQEVLVAPVGTPKDSEEFKSLLNGSTVYIKREDTLIPPWTIRDESGWELGFQDYNLNAAVKLGNEYADNYSVLDFFLYYCGFNVLVMDLKGGSLQN